MPFDNEDDLDILASDGNDEVTETDDDLSILDDDSEGVSETESEEVEADSIDDGSSDLGEDDGEGKDKEPEPKAEIKEQLTDDDLAGPPNFKRPTIGEIKKNFPDFFKKHPEMTECILRERHFTEVYPTIKMAQQAAVDQERFHNVAAKLEQGDVATLIDALGDNSEPLINNFLPTLYEKNPNKFRAITAPIFQTALRAASKSEDENVRHAADYIAHFMFGKTVKDLPETNRRVDPEVEAEREKLRKEREQTSRQMLHTAVQTVSGSVERTINVLNEKALESAKLPEARFKKVNNDIIDKVQELVSADKAHSKWMRELWASAQNANYDPVSIGKIKNAMLGRVKQLLPKARAEVIKEYGISLRPSSNPTRKVATPIAGSRPAAKTSTLPKEKTRNLSDRELLDLD